MVEKIFRARYAAFVINLFITVNTLALIVLGVLRTIQAIRHLLHVGMGKIGPDGYRPGLEFAEAIDVLLLALVFLVFTVGINVLFIRYKDQEFIDAVPQWMRVKSFTELKFLLMEAIIATSFIIFATAFIKQIESFSWKFLIAPVSILLLSLSLKILKWREKG